jgi:hypothetical protein
MRMRTIHWFDLNWSKDEVVVNETVVIEGKFHVFADWPETGNATNDSCAILSFIVFIYLLQTREIYFRLSINIIFIAFLVIIKYPQDQRSQFC